MEEYVSLGEENDQKSGKVFNWETARYGKICYDKDVHDLRFVETEFPAIVFHDSLTSNETLSYEPTRPRYIFFTLLNLGKIGLQEWIRRIKVKPIRRLAERMRLVYIRDDGQEVFVSHTLRRLFGIRVPLVQEFILEFFSTCRIRDEIGLDVADTLCFQLGEDGFGAYWLGSKRLILDKGDLSDYWRFATGRKRGALISGGKFVARLVEHFRLLAEERLQGLTVIAPALPIIDMSELEGDAGGVAEDALVAPREDEVHSMREALHSQREVLNSMASDFSRFTTWTITSLARLMDMAVVPYMRYLESSVEYKRRTRQRTDDASTSTAP
nr:hypothetical protein [Tanacetum cinerariifolium]